MSRGRPIEVEWKHSEDELRQLYNQEKHVERRTRYQALWLIRGGRPMKEVSEIVDRHYETVCRWMDWYRESGLSDIIHRLPGQAGGAESYLTSEQEAHLIDQANEGAFRTAGEIQQWLQEQFDVEYTHKGVYSLLERLDIVWKVARPSNPKADDSQQEDWKKGGLQDELEAVDLSSEDTILEVDEMRFGLHGQVRRVWAQRGVKVVQPRQFEFDYRYLTLGVNPRTGEIQWDWMAGMAAENFVDCLSDWNADGIIWDGAPSHYARVVTQLDFEFIYQPPYSPELNPVERLFQELRREVEGLVYDDLDQKQEALEDILHHWQQHPEIVRSIAGWDWICDAMNQLPHNNLL